MKECKRKEWVIRGDYAYLYIGHNNEYEIIIDQEYVDMIEEYRNKGFRIQIKKLQHTNYIRLRNTKDKTRLNFHRLILFGSKYKENSLVVDHINHNGLDNRKVNIRACTRSENARNNKGNKNRKNKYKGVCYDKQGNREKNYRAYTRVKGERIWLGYYLTPELASDAYDKYVIDNFGEYALTNKAMNNISV